MNIIEIIAVVFSLVSVILTTKNKIWCWPIGIIGSIFYGILFYQNQIWGNMIIQSFFIIQSVFGWINWSKPQKYPISWISKHNRVPILCLIGTSVVVLYCFLISTGDKMPALDSITTSLSLVAMILMAYRKIDSWLCWIIADFIFVWLFLSSQLYLSSFIYFIFLVNAFFGLVNWNKSRIKRYV